MQLSKRLKFAMGYSRINRLGNMKKYISGFREHIEEFAGKEGVRKCILIGTANYGNVGDIAISEAQLALLRRHFPGEVVDVPAMGFVEYERCLRRFLTERDVLCFQGGGNMGDMYPWFEFERCEALECFPRVRGVIMPQTFSYRDPRSPWLRYARRTYARCRDLHVFARERVSYTLMKRAYPTVDVALAPDVVLSLDPEPYLRDGLGRDGLTLVLRDDAERGLDDRARRRIRRACARTGLSVREADTVLDEPAVDPTRRGEILADMLAVFASSRAVVTDRLHGMVFAAITQTPCVVFANSNHKIAGVHEWIADLPYVRFVKDVRDVDDALAEVTRAPAVFPRARLLEEFRPLVTAVR